MGIGGPENLGKKNPFFEFLEKERQGRTEKGGVRIRLECAGETDDVYGRPFYYIIL